MPIDRKRYPKNWNQIAASAKDAAGWRCHHCQRLCLRPGEKHPNLSRSEWTKATLSVHHIESIFDTLPTKEYAKLRIAVTG